MVVSCCTTLLETEGLLIPAYFTCQGSSRRPLESLLSSTLDVHKASSRTLLDCRVSWKRGGQLVKISMLLQKCGSLLGLMSIHLR